MKTLMLCSLFFLEGIALQLRSQVNEIPNADFELWLGNTPVGWWTDNIPTVGEPVTPSTTSYTGLLSMRGEVITVMGQGAFPPVAITGSGNPPSGFPVNKQFQYLTGFFRYFPVGGDVLTIDVGMLRNGTGVGGGILRIPYTQSSWARFIVDINYISEGLAHVPDQCIIRTEIGGIPFANVGSTSFIDNISLGGTSLHSSFEFDSTWIYDPPTAVPSQHVLDRNGTAEAADDFVVPPGDRWVIQALEILGAYSRNGQGFQSATINIRADDGNRPGAVIFTDTTFVNSGPNFYIVLRDTVGLNPGRYWLNFLVNMPMGPDSSFFAWATTPTPHGAAFRWRDPANIFGNNVPQWAAGNLSGVGGGHPDLVYDLVGYNNTTSGVLPTGSNIPKRFALSQNYPNPFNPSTSIRFSIPEQSFATLTVYNILGESVATLVNETLATGSYEADWDATNVPSGVYFYALSDGRRTLSNKMVLLK